MPKIDPEACPERGSTTYPDPYRDAVRARRWRRIGEGAGLTDFGANLVTLPPRCWSSQRHWHEADDELIVMLAGELVLVDDGGRTMMAPGDIAAFPKNDGNGHHLINESDRDARFLVVGANKSGAAYPDIDLAAAGNEPFYRHKSGEPYRVYSRDE